MSIFCFKLMRPEEKHPSDETGEMKTFPAREEIVSFDLKDCKVVQDSGDAIFAYISEIKIPVGIPKEARELFLEAWKKFKGCDMQSLWKEPVGTAIYTKQSRSPASHAAVDEISEFDHHASEFMKNLKDLEDRINGVEKTFDLKGK